MDSTDSRRGGGAEPNSVEGQSEEEGELLRSDVHAEAEREAELFMVTTEKNLRFATELMDNIGQLVLLARIQLDTLAGKSVADGYASMLDRVRTLLEQAVTEIRALRSRLTPPLLAELGLEYALRHLCRQMENDIGLRVNFADDGSDKPLADLSRSIVYHAARETLCTVAHDAKGGAVRLSVGRVGAMLQLVIEDREGERDYAETMLNQRKMGGTICHCIRHLGGDIRLLSLPGGRAGIGIRVPLAVPRDQRVEGDGG